MPPEETDLARAEPGVPLKFPVPSPAPNISPSTSETSPLLPPRPCPSPRSVSTKIPCSAAEPSPSPALWLPLSRTGAVLSEARLLTRSAVPVILAYTLQNSLQTVSVLVSGWLSPEALATAAFSYMFATATAWLVGLGGTTALDTLASSCYTGAGNRHDLGVLLQRGLFVLSGFYAVAAVLWWFSEDLFRALGQEELICIQSAVFLRWLIPGGLGYIWFEATKKFLQAQGIYRPGTYVLLITSPLNALLNYLFVHTLHLGLYAAPVATGISYWISFLLLVAYATFVRGHECWGGLSPRRALSHTWPFARLAFLGIVQVGTEWWAFEIVALAAGHLGTIPLAAQSVIMTADQIINTIPFGLGIAASSRIGNLLGARSTQAAERSAHVAAGLSILVGAVILTILMVTRHVFGRIFSDDAAVIALVARVMPYVALFQIADGLSGSCGGVLRGMGKQSVGAAVNLVAYYAIALPGSIFLAFHGWGLVGLWVGLCGALNIVGGVQWVIVATSSWQVEGERALKRLSDGGFDAQEATNLV